MSNFHLSSSQMAVEYVKKHITMGASNKFSDMLGTLTVVKFCTNAMYKKIDAKMASYPDAEYVNNYDEITYNRRFLNANAEYSKIYGCGNCAEQSSLAFRYLEKQRIFPLDWVCTEDWKHAFVIINRSRGSDISNYQTWGDSAVICDPWKDVADYSRNQGGYLKNLSLNWLFGRIR